MFTPFSQETKNFTDQCHKLAQALIYPQLFGVNFDDLEFTDSSLRTTPKNTILDGQMAIDRLIKVTVARFSSSLEFMVQERFRNPRFPNYRDLTITTWNTITNLPSELYKSLLIVEVAVQIKRKKPISPHGGLACG